MKRTSTIRAIDEMEQVKPGPSRKFLMISRNVDLALNPPTRFVATVKEDGDVVI